MSARKPALSSSAGIFEVIETQPPRVTSDLIAVIELVITQLTGHGMPSSAITVTYHKPDSSYWTEWLKGCQFVARRSKPDP